VIDRINRNAALASALVEELARSGVRHAVLSPGSRSSPVALALDREPGIQLSVILDERSAGFVVLGAALATGLPSVVACTSGSAAANLHPAVVEADQAGVPLIVLSSDRPSELRGIGAGQTIDQLGLYGSAVRWFCEVGTHEADDRGLMHLRASACRAYGEAIAGRGPVHLNLAWRDPLGPEERSGDVTAAEPLALEGRSRGRPLTVPILGRQPSEELVAALVEAVKGTGKGLIVAGRQTDPDLPEAVAALAEASGFPILAEPTSGIRYGAHDREAVVCAYDAIARVQPDSLTPELVIRFGDMPTSKALRTWIESSGAEQIVIDPPGRWNEPTRRAGALVRVDAVAVAGLMAEGLDATKPTGSGWRERWLSAERAAQAAIDGVLSSEDGLSEPAIQRSLGGAFGDGEHVLLASSMPVRDAESFMTGGSAQVRFFSNRGANGIDGLVSTGCGLARGGTAGTWILLGDLALLHDLGGLAAVKAVEGPLRIVVVDNGGGGIFDFLPQAEQVEPERFERLFTTPSGIDLERVAGLFDLPFAEVPDADGLLALADRDRVLARVRADRCQNVELHHRVTRAVAEALAAKTSQRP